MLYSALKDMIEAFAGDKKSFDKPVLFEFIVYDSVILKLDGPY